MVTNPMQTRMIIGDRERLARDEYTRLEGGLFPDPPTHRVFRRVFLGCCLIAALLGYFGPSPDGESGIVGWQSKSVGVVVWPILPASIVMTLPVCIYLAERAKKTKEYKGFTNSRNSIIVRIGLTNVSWVNRSRVESKEV